MQAPVVDLIPLSPTRATTQKTLDATSAIGPTGNAFQWTVILVRFVWCSHVHVVPCRVLPAEHTVLIGKVATSSSEQGAVVCSHGFITRALTCIYISLSLYVCVCVCVCVCVMVHIQNVPVSGSVGFSTKVKTAVDESEASVVTIVDVVKGSVADQSKQMKAGDQILEINKKPASKAIAGLKIPGQLSITLTNPSGVEPDSRLHEVLATHLWSSNTEKLRHTHDVLLMELAPEAGGKSNEDDSGSPVVYQFSESEVGILSNLPLSWCACMRMVHWPCV